ncbi:hypothetical protein D3C87_1381890 [compost metagenome]
MRPSATEVPKSITNAPSGSGAVVVTEEGLESRTTLPVPWFATNKACCGVESEKAIP